MGNWKKNGLQIIMLVLCIALLSVVQRQQAEIAALSDQLARFREIRIEAERARRELSSRVTGLEAKLSEPQPDSAVSSYALEVRGVDAEQKTLLVDVSVVLALSDQNASAEIGGSVKACSLTRGAGGTYAGQLEVPLDAGAPVTLNLSTSAGGVRQFEILAQYSSVTELLPVRLGSASGDAGIRSLENVFCFTEWAFSLRDDAGKPAEITDPVLRVYRNGELVLENPCKRDDREPERYWDAVDGSHLDCRDGDTIEFRFACTDRLGLCYEFPVKWWEIKDGKSVKHWPTSAYPTLTLAE